MVINGMEERVMIYQSWWHKLIMKNELIIISYYRNLKRIVLESRNKGVFPFKNIIIHELKKSVVKHLY